MKQFILLLALGYCTIEGQIEMIRPGAGYIIHSGDYAGIEWTDKIQAKPTAQEIAQAEIDCQTLISQKATARQQAILDAKNTSKTDKDRLDALIKAIGL